jgi:hypothetical protein
LHAREIQGPPQRYRRDFCQESHAFFLGGRLRNPLS